MGKAEYVENAEIYTQPFRKTRSKQHSVAAFFTKFTKFHLSSLSKGNDGSRVVSVIVRGVMGRVLGPGDQVTQGSWCCQI